MIHFIFPGDTLQNIAEQIKLENPVYLKEFHNEHCIKEDFISQELIPGKKLLIPDFRKIQFYNSKNDAPFKSPQRNPKISFNPEKTDATFSMTIVESSEDEWKTTRQKFSYRVYLKWIKYEAGEHLFHFSTDHFSNLHQTKMNHLAIKSMQSLQPLEVYVNNKGEMVRVEVSQEKLRVQEDIMEQLYDRFPDRYAKIYLEEFQFLINKPEIFSKRMREDTFLNIYFSGFRNRFENGKSQFQLLLNNCNLSITQQGESLEDNKIELHQSLSDSLHSKNFSGYFMISENSGLPQKINIDHTYKEYSTQFTSGITLDLLS